MEVKRLKLFSFKFVNNLDLTVNVIVEGDSKLHNSIQELILVLF